MTDNLTPEDRRRTMQAIHGKRTRMEDRVCKHLWAQGLRFRRNVSTLFGKPDIAVKKRKVVVFLDSCFWHGCPEHGNLPKQNAGYWTPKLERNRARDREVDEHYRALGWTVIRVWEHEVKQDFEAVAAKITRALEQT